MYARLARPPDRTFFLFGPRGTGKTTWLRHVLPTAHWVDLLSERELVRFVRDPARFGAEVSALPGRSWVVVDEVQRAPALLDEVQRLITRHGARYRFALTGSSARKLRRGNANRLPGRAVNRRFFPLCAAEIGAGFRVERALRFGTLPAVWSARSDADRIGLLEAYAENYLAQEVRQEALVKQLESFARFLDIAATVNAQVVNVAGVARDAAIARPTVQGYFEILVDTLIGFWLPAWRPRAKVKEVAHAKFYFFDPGLVRALRRRLHEGIADEERGGLLETYVLHELRAWLDRSGAGGELAYWRTPSGSEVDFVWTRGPRAVGIEVKAAKTWRREDGAALAELAASRRITRAFGVYRGDQALKIGALHVLPVERFLAELAAGEVLR
jgi:predicted AAA+ superfamily ATPase